MAVKFYLDKRSNKAGELPIRACINIKGTSFISTIGISVAPGSWNHGKVTLKNYRNSKGQSARTINAGLHKIRQHFSKYEKRLDSRPSKSGIRTEMLTLLNRSTPPQSPKGLLEDLNHFVETESLSGQWAETTKNCWKTFRRHLISFVPQPDYKTFDEDGIDRFLAHLRYEKKLSEKTIKKTYTHLKWFLSWSIRKGYTTERSITTHRPKFKIIDKPVIFLTKEELLRLYNFSIPPNGTTVTLTDYYGKTYTKTIHESSTLSKTRDLFCFCAFTSLRYSDMAKVRRTDISGNQLYITTQKTNNRIPIDLNSFSKAILDKYRDCDFHDGLALPVISNQRMNICIKILCELCGFNSPVSISHYRSGQRIDETRPKWTLMGTHAGRRTFICFALSSGIPAQIVMKWTGHSDYKAMKPYIDIAEKSKSQAMQLFDAELRRQ